MKQRSKALPTMDQGPKWSTLVTKAQKAKIEDREARKAVATILRALADLISKGGK